MADDQISALKLACPVRSLIAHTEVAPSWKPDSGGARKAREEGARIDLDSHRVLVESTVL
jgi:hypothetical protein